jgi:hypothetical protein
MDITETTPGANIPKQQPDGPLGDRGGEKTWTLPHGEQGISNREGDEDSDAPVIRRLSHHNHLICWVSKARGDTVS